MKQIKQMSCIEESKHVIQNIKKNNVFYLLFKVKLYEEERQADKGEVKRLKVERNEMEKEKQNDVVSYGGLVSYFTGHFHK